MKIAILLPDTKVTGIFYYSKQLYQYITLQKEFITPIKYPNSYSFLYYLISVIKSNANIFHIQLEPRFFKNPLEQVFMPILAYIIKYLKRKKLIITLHAIINPKDIPLLLEDNKYGVFLKLFKPIIWYIYFMITKIILSIADKIVVHNKLIHNYTISLFKIKNKKIEIIPHGTNLTIKNIKIEKANQLNLLYLGFLRPTRNITCIIKALDILQKDFPATIKLYLLFFIPKERHSNKQISEMLSSLINISKNKSNIIILIDSKEEVIDQILNKIHIGILPYHETTLESSGVAWRYAGLGIPFIGTNVPKLLEDFKFLDKHFLFSTFSPDKIAQAIKNLFYDKELYDKISKQLICIAINRSWDKIAKEYLRLYSEVSSHEGNSNNNTL